MGNIPQEHFFDVFVELSPQVYLSLSEGGEFVIQGSEDTATPNIISFCSLNGIDEPQCTNVTLPNSYGTGIKSRVMNSQAIGYLNSTSSTSIVKVAVPYPITSDPVIEQYNTIIGFPALHPT